MRGSSATFWWSWLVGRGQEEAGPRRGAAGGGSVPARRRSGDAGVRRPGLGASGGHGEGCGVVHLDQSQAEEAVDDELELAGVTERSGGGFCARGGRPGLL